MVNQLNLSRPDPLKRVMGEIGSDGKTMPHHFMHPGGYENELNTTNQAALSNAAKGAQYVRDQMTAYDDARENLDPRGQPAKQYEDLKRHADTMEENINRKLQSVMADFDRDIEQTAITLDDAANLKIDPNYINAVTASFHQMSAGQRQAMIAQLLDDGEGSDLAILIRSSVALTGLSKEERQSIRRRAWEKAAPQTLKAYDELHAGRQRWEAGAYGLVKKMMGKKSGLDLFDAEIARVEAARKSSGFPSE